MFRERDIYIYIYIYTHTHIHMCMCVCVIYIYIYTHITSSLAPFLNVEMTIRTNLCKLSRNDSLREQSDSMNYAQDV